MKKDTPFLQSRYLNPTWVAVGALFISLIITYGTDRLSSLLEDVRQSNFLSLVGYLLAYAMPFILVAMMLVIAWALLIKYPSSRTVAIIYIVIGSLFIGTYLTAFTGFPIGLRNTIIGSFRFAIVDLGRNSNLYHLAAFWIIVGLAGLIRRPLKTESTPDEKQGKSAA
jgi:uncharacterized membrane protein YuzA (DUF378 family)